MDCFNLQYRNKIKKYKGEIEDAYLRRDCEFMWKQFLSQYVC